MIWKFATAGAVVGAAALAVFTSSVPAKADPTPYMICLQWAKDFCAAQHPDDNAAYLQCYREQRAACADLN